MNSLQSPLAVLAFHRAVQTNRRSPSGSATYAMRGMAAAPRQRERALAVVENIHD